MQTSIKDLMARKISKLESEGKDLPDWKDEIDYLNSSSNPMIASPLRLFDCSLVTDGASCVF